MADIVKQVKDKMAEINNLVSKKMRQEGEEAALLSQLKSEFNLDSLDQANAELEKINVEINNVEKTLSELDIEMSGILSAANQPAK